jgi:hypothetical protein
MFLHMFRAGRYEQVLIGVRRAASPAEIDERVSRAVQLFLAGLQALK